MIISNLFNAEDIDPNALEGDPFESVCLQLASLKKRGRPKWTPQEVKSKLIEIALQGAEEDTDENIESFLRFAGSSALAELLVKLAEHERLCCYVLKGRTLVKKVEPQNRDSHTTTLVFNDWGRRIYCYGEATRLSVRHTSVREMPKVPAKTVRFLWELLASFF